MSARAWRVEERCGTPGELHARMPAAGRTVTLCRASGPAVVLGSTQPASDIDAERAALLGLTVARRGSGGAAVMVEPETLVWVDVTLARGDPLWQDDVSVSFQWVGEAWASALVELGVQGAVVHRGRLRSTPWSRALCFAGLGPGEVTVAGRKLVGLSQRRRRDLAWFTMAMYLEPAHVGLEEVVAGGRHAREGAAVALGQLATDLASVGVARTAPCVETALVAHLPR